MDDCTQRLGDVLGPVTPCADALAVADWASAAGLEQVVMHYPPTGPAADALIGLRGALAQRGITLCTQIRPLDQLAWPSATAGFYRFRQILPDILAQARA